MIKGFKVELDSTHRPTDNGPYDIDSNLQADEGTIAIPITGIYLVSVSVPIGISINAALPPVSVEILILFDTTTNNNNNDSDILIDA